MSDLILKVWSGPGPKTPMGTESGVIVRTMPSTERMRLALRDSEACGAPCSEGARLPHPVRPRTTIPANAKPFIDTFMTSSILPYM
ncbi:hypothetical protein D3C72_1616520 [compost metagenome]